MNNDEQYSKQNAPEYVIQVGNGVDDEWITHPQKTGPLGAALHLKAQRLTIEVINEDRGEWQPCSKRALGFSVVGS